MEKLKMKFPSRTTNVSTVGYKINIHHRPIFDIKTVIDHYTEKDGVPINYVCTSALGIEGIIDVDVFYRNTPHPVFGNRYFGLYYDMGTRLTLHKRIMITNADSIEDLTFEMILVNDQLHYSRSRWDYNQVGDVAIDGGRSYTRLVGNTDVPRVTLKVKDGRFEYA